MKSVSIAVLLAFTSACLVSAEELNKSWTVGPNAEVHVQAGDASISVEGGDSSTIRAKLETRGVSIGENGVVFVEHQTGDAVDIRLEEHHDHWGLGSRSIHLSLVVPRNVTLSVKTGDGSIHLSRLNGKLRVGTGDGSVEGSDLDGLLDARSGDGSMHLEGVFNSLHVHTGDGSIDLRAGSGSKVDMGWELSSGDGSISLRVPKDLSADVDLRTGDGHITTDVPITVTEMSGKHQMRGKLNGGGASLAVRTGDGSIHLATL